MAIVTMRYWAAAKDAAGIAEETVTADTLAGALAVIGADDRDRRPPAGRAPAAGGARLSTVLARSSFLINGNPVGTRAPDAVPLADGAVIEVLPPFAGG
jgi:molybdopterin synthase sulfur carrier subunit